MKVLLCPLTSDIPKIFAMFDGSQASPICPSDDSSIKVKMKMEHWWNDTDGKNLSSAPLSTTNLGGLA
jgi:hypothetical protein